MVYFLVGLVLLTLALFLRRSFSNANPVALARGLRLAAALALVAVGGAFSLTGRGAVGLPILFFGFGMLMQSARPSSGTAAPSDPSGRASGVETAWLEMTLDHNTGAVSGMVRRGNLAGRTLESLQLSEIMSLIAECSTEDPQSAQLLMTWLDREQPGWRERGRNQPPDMPGARRMSAAEAYEILGLQPGADRQAVLRAYRDLINRNHPDRGGSSWLAARINEARDTLLKD